MPTLEKLVDGFKVYRTTTYARDKELFAHQLMAKVQPSTLVITTPDLHVAPEVLTSSTPGDMYVMRMKAGIVPPFSPDRISGFTATLEFGVVNLAVQNIVVLGHSDNDGLQMLLDGKHLASEASDPLRAWLSYAQEVCDAVKRDMGDRPRADQEQAMELETIVMNLRNLFSYPWVAERVEKGRLEIYGWHFNIATGDLLGYMPGTGMFESMI